MFDADAIHAALLALDSVSTDIKAVALGAPNGSLRRGLLMADELVHIHARTQAHRLGPLIMDWHRAIGDDSGAMPVVDTSYRCDECDADFATVKEAHACAVRDRWDQKLADNAPRLYEAVRRVADHEEDSIAEAAALVEELGPPAPPRTT